ncbi:hypothetical protein LZ32DRAFT_653712 [Colletotrichum eremochloae]|nr:hypothetical protein LZ32DRAFT_653712 [Colletotrichum eremochloae]
MAATVYLLLYPRQVDLPPDSKDVTIFGGRTLQDPHTWKLHHMADFNIPTIKYPHFAMPRLFGIQQKANFLMMKLTEAKLSLVAMAETTICCFFRTWHPLHVEWFDESTNEWFAYRYQQSQRFGRKKLTVPSDDCYSSVGGDINLTDQLIYDSRSCN